MKICVDPGHGMSNRQMGIFDSGATHVENGFLFKEADIALGYALALKDTFRAKGVEVFMTRDDATDHAPVGRRAAMARNAGCDVLVSLHLNDFDDDAANGLEVLFRDTEDKALAQKLQDALVKVTKMRDRRSSSERISPSSSSMAWPSWWNLVSSPTTAIEGNYWTPRSERPSCSRSRP